MLSKKNIVILDLNLNHKIIRDNLQFYLKNLRAEIAQLKVRLEPMKEYSNKLNEINERKNTYSKPNQQ